MKNFSTAPPQDARRSLRSGLAALLLTGVTASLVTSASAQTVKPPTGTVWDCVLSGSGQNGIAFITFADDQNFSGYQILSTSPKSAPSLDGRNIGGGGGRGTSTGSTNQASSTNLFGFAQVAGPWAYDTKGKVIGNWTMASGDGSTNGVTNSVSFVATVVPGKRLTLVASTPNGKLTYKGVPYTQTTHILNGKWYGSKQANGQSYTELYTFTSVADSNPFGANYPDLASYPGIYFTADGQGAGYTLMGFSMVSSQKKTAFAFQSYAGGGTNGVLNASFGSITTKGTLKATTAGIEEPNSAIHYTFLQPLQPLPPPAGQ